MKKKAEEPIIVKAMKGNNSDGKKKGTPSPNHISSGDDLLDKAFKIALKKKKTN